MATSTELWTPKQRAALEATAPEMYDMLRSLQRIFASPNFTDRCGYADRIAAILAKVDEA